MRLIDADKLRFRHTVKCNSNTTRPYTLNCISFDEVQNAPTIKAVPIDVLDRIRAEIEQIEINGYVRDVECFNAGINTALNVINKYKAERSE